MSVIINILVKNLKTKNSELAASELVTKATQKWKIQHATYRDDITVIVAYFNCEKEEE